jgi:uncharacterized membrane protein
MLMASVRFWRVFVPSVELVVFCCCLVFFEVFGILGVGVEGFVAGVLLCFVVLVLMLFVVGVPVRVFAVAGVDEARVIACYDRLSFGSTTRR